MGRCARRTAYVSIVRIAVRKGGSPVTLRSELQADRGLEHAQARRRVAPSKGVQGVHTGLVALVSGPHGGEKKLEGGTLDGAG